MRHDTEGKSPFSRRLSGAPESSQLSVAASFVGVSPSDAIDSTCAIEHPISNMLLMSPTIVLILDFINTCFLVVYTVSVQCAMKMFVQDEPSV